MTGSSSSEQQPSRPSAPRHLADLPLQSTHSTRLPHDPSIGTHNLSHPHHHPQSDPSLMHHAYLHPQLQGHLSPGSAASAVRPGASAGNHDQLAPPDTVAAVAGRPPRSRKSRPCDSCRKSKSRCSIGPQGPPCTPCSETKKHCTFNFAPPPRKALQAKQVDTPLSPSNYPDESSTSASGRPLVPQAGYAQPRSLPTVSPTEVTGRGTNDESQNASLGKRKRQAYIEPQSDVLAMKRWSRRGQRATASESTSRADSTDCDRSGLDILASAVPTFDHFADLEDYEPHVLTNPLTDDLLPISHENSGVKSSKEVDRAHVKQISADPSRPVFVILNPKSSGQDTALSGIQSLRNLRTFLGTHPSNLSEASLIKQYHYQVHPAWPILPNGKTQLCKPQLLAAIITTSFIHLKETRPWAPMIVELLRASSTWQTDNNLAGVAASVLELGLRPATSSRSGYMLLAKTIALAQLLGMHLNPLQWAIPPWEQELRIRLWWCLVIHDAWMSFLNSRPCHIQAYNSTVPLPSLSSVLVASCAHGSSSSESARSFIASCRLSKLVCRLQAEVGTLGALSARSTVDRKEEVKDIAKLANGLLQDWKGYVQRDRLRPTGVPSLLLHLLGFRCMLKRIHIELEYGFGAMFDPDAEILAPFRDCLSFLVSLSAEELDGYFLNYASHILSSITSSLIRLTLAPPSSQCEQAMDLLAKLVSILHFHHTNHGWDVAAPAIRRAAAVASKLRGHEEHIRLCEALLSGDPQLTPQEHPGALGIDTGGASEVPVHQHPLAEANDPELAWDLSGMDWGLGDLDLNNLLNIPMAN